MSTEASPPPYPTSCSIPAASTPTIRNRALDNWDGGVSAVSIPSASPVTPCISATGITAANRGEPVSNSVTQVPDRGFGVLPCAEGDDCAD
ncbi:hypothetical protein MFIFM68171_09526 [Madurella fahalii]|uniref:Uncharacterized protein n=1 Tax=Madurella fahalii TaxID=1157608 RepID=A0ABQ0GNM2_9PEZI